MDGVVIGPCWIHGVNLLWGLVPAFLFTLCSSHPVYFEPPQGANRRLATSGGYSTYSQTQVLFHSNPHSCPRYYKDLKSKCQSLESVVQSSHKITQQLREWQALLEKFEAKNTALELKNAILHAAYGKNRLLRSMFPVSRVPLKFKTPSGKTTLLMKRG